MAERRLNINAPLLSVRRFSIKSSSFSNEEDGKVFGSSTPSRRHNVGDYRLDSVLDQVTEPVAVPFRWEQIPGRRKDMDEHEPAHEPVQKEAPVTPRLPPGRVFDDQCEDRHRLRALPVTVTENVTKLKSFGDGDNEDDEDNDVAFSDALDVLTTEDSSSMTCSISGLSSVDVKPPDVQARDFMMSRFLPAAKAMTLQPKKAEPKKSEEPRQDKMVVAVKRPPSPMKYGGFTLPHYGQDKEQEEESEEDQDEEHYDARSITAKGCGLFTRLCLQSSLRLLNSGPGMKPRTRALMPPSKSEVERPTRTHIPTIKRDVAYKHKSGELPKLIQKDVFYKHKSGELPKLNRKDVFYKHKSGELPRITQKDFPYKYKSGELPKLTQKVTGGSQRFSFSGNLETMGRLSPSRRSGGISPYRREAPQSPFRGAGFLGVPKEVEGNKVTSPRKGEFVDQKLLSLLRTKRGPGSGSITPAAEKTLYVDTVSTNETLRPSLSFPDVDVISDFSFQDIKCLDIAKDPFTLHQTVSSNAVKACDKFSFSNASLANDGEYRKVEDLAIVKVDSEDSPLPPPLPKSPSESWLWRTLPSANVQSSHLRTQFSRRSKDIVKPSTPNTKWETIVKTSNPRHDHARYSQELISHPSQPYKT